MSKTGDTFEKFTEVVRKLRDPNGGCPWDLEQTHETLRPYVVEETYEVLEAIDAKDDAELKKELGDLLLQVVLHAQVARDRDAFTIDDVVEAVTDKMIRRHPHVFGDVKVTGSGDVLKNWEAIKLTERQSSNGSNERPASVLDGVPTALPALIRAQRLGHKAAKVSFDWKSVEGVWEKVSEELEEFRAEINHGESAKERQAEELGDLLFVLCQVARWLDISAEDALRECCNRFVARFTAMEQQTKKPFSEMSEDQLEAAWQEAKASLAGRSKPNPR